MGTLKVFKQGIHLIRAVLQAVVMGKVDWNGQSVKAGRAWLMDPGNFPSRWIRGDQCERWFRRTDMDLGKGREKESNCYINWTIAKPSFECYLPWLIPAPVSPLS